MHASSTLCFFIVLLAHFENSLCFSRTSSVLRSVALGIRQGTYTQSRLSKTKTSRSELQAAVEMCITPDSIENMMRELGKGMKAAKESGKNVMIAELPIPVTGGTELDDWPGGIPQKYATLAPMLKVTMQSLNFTSSAISERKYIGTGGEEDAVGVWADNGYTLCCFCTPDSIEPLKDRLTWADSTTLMTIVNNQFFLDPLSREESKEFVGSLDFVFLLENLNMRGPNALPVRGILYRVYPGNYIAGRRKDGGGYIKLKEYAYKPSRAELEDLFYEDSEIRDANLTMKQRIMRMIPQLPQ